MNSFFLCQVFTNLLKIPSIQDMDDLNNKMTGYEGIDSPSQLSSVGEESRTSWTSDADTCTLKLLAP